MVDSRRDITPWLSLVQEIDSSLNKIHDLFSRAFAEGKEKPERMEEAHKVNLFDEIWLLLSTPGINFPSLRDLSAYYQNLSAQLEIYIDDFCLQKNQIPKDSISENKRAMLARIIDVYFALIKQKYILSQFKPGDEPDIFANYISRIKTECAQAEAELESVSGYEAKKILATIEEIFWLITSTLNNEGYIGKSFPFKQSERIECDQLYLMSVNAQLKKLPTQRAMLEITRQFENARQRGDKEEMNRCKTEIRFLMLEQQNLKTGLNNALSEMFRAYEEKKTQWVQRNISIVDKLRNISQRSRLLNIYELLLQMNGYDERDDEIKKGYKQLLTEAAANAQAACKMQSPAEKLSFGFWAKGWNLAGVELGTLRILAEKIEVFMAEYSDPQQVLLSVKKIKEKTAVLQSYCAALQKKIAQADAAWKECGDAIQEMEGSILQSYLDVKDEDTKEYVKSFLLHHWWKMALGGAGGGGGTTALAILVLALGPAGVGVLAGAGLAGGAAAGVGAGLLGDRFFKKSESAPEGSESAGLLAGGKPQNYSTMNKTDDTERAMQRTAEPSQQSTSWLSGFPFFWGKTASGAGVAENIKSVSGNKPSL